MKGIYDEKYPMMDKQRSAGKDSPITGHFLTNLYAGMERRLPYPNTADEKVWKEWRTELRAQLKELMAIDSWGDLERIPAFEITEEKDCGNYMRKKIAFETVSGNWMFAYLLVPKNITGQVPAVLCPHGHFDNASLSVVQPESAAGTAYAHEFAELGFIAMAPENAGNGERDVPLGEVFGQNFGGCDLLFRRLNHLGKDLTGFRVYELTLCLNLLCSLGEVDKNRIGCAGLSGGCWLSQVLSALDERIKAVILSGYFTTFAQTAWSGHCVCHHPKGIGLLCDMTDLSALIAPGFQFIESGKDDTLYPPQPAYDIVKKAYELLFSGENLDIDIFEGGHMFRGTKSIPWLADVLNNKLRYD